MRSAVKASTRWARADTPPRSRQRLSEQGAHALPAWPGAASGKRTQMASRRFPPRSRTAHGKRSGSSTLAGVPPPACVTACAFRGALPEGNVPRGGRRSQELPMKIAALIVLTLAAASILAAAPRPRCLRWAKPAAGPAGARATRASGASRRRRCAPPHAGVCVAVPAPLHCTQEEQKLQAGVRLQQQDLFQRLLPACLQGRPSRTTANASRELKPRHRRRSPDVHRATRQNRGYPPEQPGIAPSALAPPALLPLGLTTATCRPASCVARPAGAV